VSLRHDGWSRNGNKSAVGHSVAHTTTLPSVVVYPVIRLEGLMQWFQLIISAELQFGVKSGHVGR
jgi:hypothetical protein